MEKHWYVFKVRQYNIPVFKEMLETAGIENFIPFRREKIREDDGKLNDRLRPLVLNYVFIRCDISAFDYGAYPFPVYPCFDCATCKPMIVPDVRMHDFMFIYDFSKKAMILCNDRLRRGDRVRVIKGEFAGIVGELVRIGGHRRVVVRLEGLFSLAVDTYLPKSYLEPLT